MEPHQLHSNFLTELHSSSRGARYDEYKRLRVQLQEAVDSRSLSQLDRFSDTIHVKEMTQRPKPRAAAPGGCPSGCVTMRRRVR